MSPVTGLGLKVQAPGKDVMTVVAIAQSKDDWQLPMGDVWITPGHPYLFYLHPREKTSTTGTAMGDVWVVPDQDERSAQSKSERQEEAKSGQKNSAASIQPASKIVPANAQAAAPTI